ncbi:hypothetical protein ACOMHN_001550 [Nucella lapillus]
MLQGQVCRAVMRAIRVHQFGAPEVMKVEKDLPIPVPGDTQVLLKVEAAGVNPVDTYIRSGAYARLPTLPYTPGSDAAGTVEAVGGKVTAFKKGDRAYTVRSVSGAYAEYCMSEEVHTGHLSQKLSFPQGAALGVPYYTAYRAMIKKAQVKAGETVLIHGASGAVGVACLQIAKSVGCKVLGTAGTPEGMAMLKKLGIDGAFNHRQEGYTALIMSATDSAGPDVIVEMLSDVNLQRDLEMAKTGARIAVIGCRGTVEVNPRLMMAKELQVMGIMMQATTPEEFRQVHSYLGAGCEAGWLSPSVHHQYPLEEAAVCHQDIVNSAGAQGKLVLTTHA